MEHVTYTVNLGELPPAPSGFDYPGGFVEKKSWVWSPDQTENEVGIVEPGYVLDPDEAKVGVAITGHLVKARAGSFFKPVPASVARFLERNPSLIPERWRRYRVWFLGTPIAHQGTPPTQYVWSLNDSRLELVPLAQTVTQAERLAVWMRMNTI